jgi:hypothetical protein
MRERWIRVGVIVVLIVGVGTILLRSTGRTIAPGGQSSLRKSFWRAPPHLQNAADVPAPAAPPPTARSNGPALQVLVEDATGGPIGGAKLLVKDQAVGVTDQAGHCDVALGTPGLTPTGTLEAKAAGYAPGSSAYAAPGRLLVQLLPGSRISGTVVEVGTGHPVPGLEVFADNQSTMSAADGQFSLRDITAGKHHLRAVGPHHAGQLARPVSVGPGAAVDGIRLEVAPSYAISGRIVSAGQPVRHRTLVMGAGSTGASDMQGSFELRGVRPGTHRLSLYALGPAFFGFKVDEVEVTVVDHDVVQDIDIGPRHSMVIEVRDRAGRPLSKINVRGEQRWKGSLKNEGCQTDAAGTCGFEGLIPGEIILTIDGGKRPALTVPLPAAQPARFVLDNMASIEGKVLTTAGLPPDPYSIKLTSAAGGRPDHEQSGPDGAFAFLGLDSGAYTLDVSPSFYQQSPPLQLATLPITLAADEARRDLVLTVPDADAHLDGQVVDETGRPVADVLVSSWMSGSGGSAQGSFYAQPPLAVTDPDGRFTLPRRLARAHYDVAALAPDGSQGQVAGAAPNAPVVIHLLPRGGLTVQVPNHTGFLTEVTILDQDKVVARSMIMAEGEAADFDALLPGPRTVRVGTAAHHAEAKVEIHAGATATVTLPLP